MKKEKIKQRYLVEIEVDSEEFCSLDLEEAICDGAENVGNYEIKNINISEI